MSLKPFWLHGQIIQKNISGANVCLIHNQIKEKEPQVTLISKTGVLTGCQEVVKSFTEQRSVRSLPISLQEATQYRDSSTQGAKLPVSSTRKRLWCFVMLDL